MKSHQADFSRQALLDRLKYRSVVIWGARMTGMGFVRFLQSAGHAPALAFIDSDPALHGKRINGVDVYPPAELNRLKSAHENLLVVISVSLKEHEIIRNLRQIGFDEPAWLVYSEYCADFYTVDVVGTCNLKCPSCAHGTSGMESPLGTMKYDIFEQVLGKMLKETEVVSHVSLYSWGEPLLHPDLGKIIRLLHSKGIAVAVSSNLSIKQEKPLRQMMEAAPDYLKVSLSGYYPEAYDKTHTGGNINLVKSNLYRLRYLMDEYGASTLVDVNYHLYSNNCGKNLEKMRELCRELGFSLSTTYALVMPLERVINHCDGVLSPELDKLRSMLLVDIAEGIEASSGVAIDGCPFRDNQVNINWDLSVPVCCTVFNRNPATVLTANYLQSPLSEINHRKTLVSLCDKCTSLGLPAYNMGFNRSRWEAVASTKPTWD